MRIRRAFAAAIAGGTIATMAFSAAALAASTIVVTDGNAAAHGWEAQHSTCGGVLTGSQIMEEGPETPPLGSGSREFRIGADGNSFETFRLDAFDGTLLSDLTSLSYWTYVESGGSGGQAPYLNLLVDWTNDGVTDDQLFFEPVYQTTDFGVPNQGPLLVGEWQDWDALIGGWWALSDGAFGPPLITLEDYIAEHPTAQLTDSLTFAGSVRIATGCGGAAWTNFVGNADAFTIGATGADTITYDFEVTNEPGNAEDCKDGGWQGLTDDEGEPFSNQGQCVKHANDAGPPEDE